MRTRTRTILLTAFLALLAAGCSGGGDGPEFWNNDYEPPSDTMPAPNTAGDAILDIQLIARPVQLGGASPDPNAIPGYTLLGADLNEGSGGDYVWLYYQTGPADGSEGRPLGEIYTVDETDGETVKDVEDIKLPVNLNSGTPVEGNRIFLACCDADWPVVRGIVFANVDDMGETISIVDAPPGISSRYPVIWATERIEGSWDGVIPNAPWPSDAQDLNEGTSWLFPPILSDYNYIGYCVDQEIYDWLNP
jgi:hypothetical protein